MKILKFFGVVFLSFLLGILTYVYLKNTLEIEWINKIWLPIILGYQVLGYYLFSKKEKDE